MLFGISRFAIGLFTALQASAQDASTSADSVAGCWQEMVNAGKQEAVFAETAALKTSKDEALAREATFFSARLNGALGPPRRKNFPEDLDWIEAKYASDPRHLGLRLKWADTFLEGERRLRALNRLAEEHP